MLSRNSYPIKENEVPLEYWSTWKSVVQSSGEDLVIKGIILGYPGVWYLNLQVLS